jgi:hypothetical protein
MNILIKIIRNPHIQVALVTGLCIITLAVVFKRILHLELSNLESGLPALVFFIFEAGHKKFAGKFWGRPLFWNLLLIALTGSIIILRII